MSLLYTNRRDFLQALIGGAAGLSFTHTAFGQGGTPQPIKATKLTDQIALLSGDGGNVAVVIGDDGLMMIDGGLPTRPEELQKAIAENVDAHKVRILFDTHWHFDHIGSNELLGASGTKIIGHENVKKRLSVKTDSPALGRSFDPLKPEGLPKETFTKGGKMTFGKQKIEYTYFALGHTDSDSFVFFPNANVLHTGDLYFSGVFPIIDYSTGGWIGGMAKACDVMLKIGDAKTQIIPGHGPMASKEDLKASRDMLHTVYERLEVLSKQGKTLDEVIASNPIADLDAKWGKPRASSVFLKTAYPSIAAHAKQS